MTRYLVELIGEQPVTNLLSVRYLKPDAVLFVGTREWHEHSRHLQTLLGQDLPIHVTELNRPYDPDRVLQAIESKISKLGWAADELTFNLSGGTRMMAFAAFALARDGRSQLVDLEYFGSRYHVRRYRFDEDRAHKVLDEPLPDLLTISDYVRAHAPGFESMGFSRDGQGRIDLGGDFEAAVYEALKSQVDELLPGVRPKGVANQIEIDLVIRIGNSIGLMEMKTGANKAGIDQLDTAGNPTYLGNHVVKFLVTGRYLSRAHKSLASAQQVQVIELPGYQMGRSLNAHEQRNLLSHINSYLG